VDGPEGFSSVRVLLLISLLAAIALSSDDIFDEDAIVILDEEDELVLIVRQRTAAPLSPSSRTIKADEFQGKFSDLPSVLETVSGINIRSMGGHGQYAESAIRGASSQGIRVYLDGVLLNSASSGAVDLSKIPLDRIREVRVTKSTSGLRQMGAGMGGVVELFTDDSPKPTGTDDTRRGDRPRPPAITGINMEAGSFGHVKGSAIIRKPINENVSHQLNMEASSSNNDYPYMHDNGTTIPTLRDPDPTWDDTLFRKRNNHYRSADAAYSLSVDIKDNHRVSQQISAGAFEQGLFVYHYKDDQSGSTGGSSIIYSIDYRGIISEKLTIGGEASGIYRHSSISDPDGKFSLGGAGKELESTGGAADVVVDARYSLTDNFYLAGLAGVRTERHTQRNKALKERPEMTRYEYKAGAEAGLKAGAAESALRAVYKYEVDTSTAGLGYWSAEGKKLSLAYPAAEAALRVNLNPLTVQLSAAASKRSPTFFERFGWGSGFVSNPDLKEETRMEADIGVSVDMGEYTGAVSVFAGTTGGKIKSIPHGGGFVKVMNFADTRFYGAEADVNAKLLRVLTLELSASYLNSTISNAVDPAWINKTEPFVSELSGFIKTEADMKPFQVGHGIKYEGECYLGVDNREKRPAQTELSAWASYKITEHFSARYRVDNYLNTASFDFMDNPKPRRTHAVSAALTF